MRHRSPSNADAMLCDETMKRHGFKIGVPFESRTPTAHPSMSTGTRPSVRTMASTAGSRQPSQPRGHSYDTDPSPAIAALPSCSKLRTNRRLSFLPFSTLRLIFSDPFLKFRRCQDVYGVHGRLPCRCTPLLLLMPSRASFTFASSAKSRASVNRHTSLPIFSPTLPSPPASLHQPSSNGDRQFATMA